MSKSLHGRITSDLLSVVLVRGVSAQQAVLEVLVRGENYGVGIRDLIRERCGLDFGPGSLYTALHALEREGLVESHAGDTIQNRGGRPRIYYKLTALGERTALRVREQVSALYGWG